MMMSSLLGGGKGDDYLYYCRDISKPDDAFKLNKNLQVIGIISIFSSLLSIFGAGSIVIYTVWKKVYQSPEVAPLLHLSAADLILSVLWMLSSITYFATQNVIHPEITAVVCFVFQLFTEMIHIVTFFLTINYSVNVLLRMIDRVKSMVVLLEPSFKSSLWSDSVDYHWLQPFLYGISWLLPIFLLLPLMLKASSKQISACQKCIILIDVPRLENVGHLWRFYGYYLLVATLCVSMTSILVIYFCSLRIYWKAVPGFHTDRQRRILGNMQTRVTLYILVFLVCWSPALVICLYKVTLTDSKKGPRTKPDVVEYFAFFVLQALLAPMQGFLNSMVYGWSRKSFRAAVPPEQTRLMTEPSEMVSDLLDSGVDDGLSAEVRHALDREALPL